MYKSSSITALAGDMQSLTSAESVLYWDSGEADLYREKFLSLVPDWSTSLQMWTPNPHSLIGSNNTTLSGCNGAALINW